MSKKLTKLDVQKAIKKADYEIHVKVDGLCDRIGEMVSDEVQNIVDDVMEHIPLYKETDDYEKDFMMIIDKIREEVIKKIKDNKTWQQ